MSLMGIDLGTSSCKGVVFDHDGRVLASASHGYEMLRPRPNWAEMDANLFWEAVVCVSRTLSAQVVQDPVTAFAISSQGETIIPTDRRGNPSRPAFMNADNRAVQEVERLNRELGRQRIYEITGEPPHTMFGLFDIMWFQQNDPDLYRRTEHFASCEDFILMKMGFDPLCNYSNCCRTLMLDIRRHDWSDEILSAAGIGRDKLGIPVKSGAFVGKLDRHTAKWMGLQEGTAVVTGGHDQPCAGLGSGVLGSGVVSDAAGSYEGLVAAVTQPNTSEQALACSLNTYCHVLDDRFLSLAFFPSGFATNWYVSQFCEPERTEAAQSGVSVFDILEQKVAALEDGPTGLYVLPHFVGSCNPYNDIRATGTVIGLTPEVDRATLYKAIYEGIAYEFAVVSEVLEQNTGPITDVRINGGGAKSAFTLALRANTSGRKLSQLETNESVCLGAAMLAGVATGVYRDAQDAVNRTVRIRRVVEPDPAQAALYRKPLQIYRSIYESLAPVRELMGAQ